MPPSAKTGESKITNREPPGKGFRAAWPNQLTICESEEDNTYGSAERKQRRLQPCGDAEVRAGHGGRGRGGPAPRGGIRAVCGGRCARRDRSPSHQGGRDARAAGQHVLRRRRATGPPEGRLREVP